MHIGDKTTSMLLQLMKVHNIRKVIASPGSRNMAVVTAVQDDPYFEVYSAPEERSAAYMACGLAAESGEAVAITCTGATASRNYVPGITEAYYRQLPILVLTSGEPNERIGHLAPQVIDTRVAFNDLYRYDTQIPAIHNADDEWAVNIELNKALLALDHRGRGPVHIHFQHWYPWTLVDNEVHLCRPIRRLTLKDELPEIPKGKKAIFVGAHLRWSKALTTAVESFCEKYDCVVIGDHTSNYSGRYWINGSVTARQDQYLSKCKQFDLIIHLGETSGSYITLKPKAVWRVHEDGELRDTFKALENVFEMSELEFFERYNSNPGSPRGAKCYAELSKEEEFIRAAINELPFSNAWMGEVTTPKIPANSSIHFGILNSLSSWNPFELHESISAYCNTGGFGIDGCMSSAVGGALADPQRLTFLVIGDLAFFYDMSVLGNHHVGRNLRILLVNNGLGTEFRNYYHIGDTYGKATDEFISAAGHYGNKSPRLVKNYAEDLGFTYLAAANKHEYLASLDYFVDPNLHDRPILFEVFTEADEESAALRAIRNARISRQLTTKQAFKAGVKRAIGEKSVRRAKKLMGR